jgi:hypothetical protein
MTTVLGSLRRCPSKTRTLVIAILPLSWRAGFAVSEDAAIRGCLHESVEFCCGGSFEDGQEVIVILKGLGESAVWSPITGPAVVPQS